MAVVAVKTPIDGIWNIVLLVSGLIIHAKEMVNKNLLIISGCTCGAADA